MSLLRASGLLFLSTTLLALASGCGSEVNVGGGGGGGGEGGEGAGNAECAPFLDQDSAGAVTFRVVNDSGQDLYLRGSCASISYGIEPQSGADDTYYGEVGGACQQSCEDLQTSEPSFCEADACAPSSIRVRAGESRDISWAGLGQKSVTMPGQCFYSSDFGSSCQQILAAQAGTYELALNAFSDCGAECTCDEQTGVCSGEAGGVEASPESSSFTFPTSAAVDIVFPGCAFGCPG